MIPTLPVVATTSRLRGFVFLATLAFAPAVPRASRAQDTKNTNLSPQGSPLSQTRVATDSDRPVLQRRDDRYRLCASDVIALTFPLTPEFDQTVNIQQDGFASLTGVGDIHLEGLTAAESLDAIRAAYAKVLNNPIVTMELKNFNKPYFIVNGQVHSPGRYDLRGYTTATQAIAMAGGFEDSAKHSQVLLFRRVNNDWYEVKNINLKHILQGHDVNEDPAVRSGDMLFVPTVSSLQERDPDSIPAIYRESYRLIFFLAVPAFAFLTLMSPIVSTIWIGRYEPVFILFVTLLATGWLVNVLSNPAYVMDLGTGALHSISIGCAVTAVLNAGLGFAAGKIFGGTAVVAAAVFALIVGYAIVLASYHVANRVSFAQLVPSESAGILITSVFGAAIFFPLLRASQAHSVALSRTNTAILAALVTMVLLPMWIHPMRKRVVNWVFSRVPA